MSRGRRAKDAPHAQHVDEMLLGDVVLAVDVPLQRGEDALPPQERIPTVHLELEQRLIGLAVLIRSSNLSALLIAEDRQSILHRSLGWNGKVLELLSKDDDGLLQEERVLHVGLRGRGRLAQVATRAFWWSVEVVTRRAEEIEHELQTLSVELWRNSGQPSCSESARAQGGYVDASSSPTELP